MEMDLFNISRYWTQIASNIQERKTDFTFFTINDYYTFLSTLFSVNGNFTLPTANDNDFNDVNDKSRIVAV